MPGIRVEQYCHMWKSCVDFVGATFYNFSDIAIHPAPIFLSTCIHILIYYVNDKKYFIWCVAKDCLRHRWYLRWHIYAFIWQIIYNTIFSIFIWPGMQIWNRNFSIDGDNSQYSDVFTYLLYNAFLYIFKPLMEQWRQLFITIF